MSRIAAAKIALAQAGERQALCSVRRLLSLPDTVEAAAAAGVTAIIQLVVAAGQAPIAATVSTGYGFTNRRYFKH